MCKPTYYKKHNCLITTTSSLHCSDIFPLMDLLSQHSTPCFSFLQYLYLHAVTYSRDCCTIHFLLLYQMLILNFYMTQNHLKHVQLQFKMQCYSWEKEESSTFVHKKTLSLCQSLPLSIIYCLFLLLDLKLSFVISSHYPFTVFNVKQKFSHATSYHQFLSLYIHHS